MRGFLCINKPPGMSSHDVVVWARRLLGIKKIGHTGTLDPAAAGVLVLAIGEATKVLEFMNSETKEYRVECILGVTTDSQDSTGKITDIKSCTANEEEIRSLLPKFTGEVWQIPPMVSAVKYRGNRLYKLARQGITVAREARKVQINRLEIVPVCTDTGQLVNVQRISMDEVVKKFVRREQFEYSELTGCVARVMFDVECSRGTYVRTLCHDLGQSLGCGGCMSFLLRTRSGPFGLDQARTLESVENDLSSGKSLPELLLPISYGLPNLPTLVVSQGQRKRLSNGSPVFVEALESVPESTHLLVVTDDNVEVCIARIRYESGTVRIQPAKVFA